VRHADEIRAAYEHAFEALTTHIRDLIKLSEITVRVMRTRILRSDTAVMKFAWCALAAVGLALLAVGCARSKQPEKTVIQGKVPTPESRPGLGEE
jgi:hypothetical protein